MIYLGAKLLKTDDSIYENNKKLYFIYPPNAVLQLF